MILLKFLACEGRGKAVGWEVPGEEKKNHGRIGAVVGKIMKIKV